MNKFKNKWCNLTKIKVVKGDILPFKTVECNKVRIFRIDINLKELDQIMIINDPEYYICTKISIDCEVEGIESEIHIEYMSLQDYYIYEFHKITDDENLSWQEKPMMVRDLSNEISDIFSKCKIVEIDIKINNI